MDKNILFNTHYLLCILGRVAKVKVFTLSRSNQLNVENRCLQMEKRKNQSLQMHDKSLPDSSSLRPHFRPEQLKPGKKLSSISSADDVHST